MSFWAGHSARLFFQLSRWYSSGHVREPISQFRSTSVDNAWNLGEACSRPCDHRDRWSSRDRPFGSCWVRTASWIRASVRSRVVGRAKGVRPSSRAPDLSEMLSSMSRSIRDVGLRYASVMYSSRLPVHVSRSDWTSGSRLRHLSPSRKGWSHCNPPSAEPTRHAALRIRRRSMICRRETSHGGATAFRRRLSALWM